MQILNERKKEKMFSKLGGSGKKSQSCHLCDSEDLVDVLDLGHHPPSDAFLTYEQLQEEEGTYPLRLVRCSSCGLLQIDYIVDPVILFKGDYPYESSATKTAINHYSSMAGEISEKFSHDKDSLVVDIGSNVGVLLRGFKKAGFDNVLGVDPAEPAARKAIVNGISSIIDFFNEGTAKRIIASYGKAKIITATNVFAHMSELKSALAGMKELLDTDGVIVIESPYALDMIDNLEYDTIYHEHIMYLSVKPLERFFKQFGLEIFDLFKTPIHGGSLRYYVGFRGQREIADEVQEFINREEARGLYNADRLKEFSQNVQQQKKELINLLVKLKNEGKTIVGISAPAKGNTLLNYCEIDDTFLDYLTDKVEYKTGRFSPGTHLEVFTDDKIAETKPDYGLILAWNFAEEIMKNLSFFKKRGGKFIIPIPRPRIID